MSEPKPKSEMTTTETALLYTVVILLVVSTGLAITASSYYNSKPFIISVAVINGTLIGCFIALLVLTKKRKKAT